MSIDRNDVGDALDRFKKIVETVGGCSDGYCLVTGKAKGMHTNGGCRCNTDKYKAQRVMRAAWLLVDSLEDILGH